MLGLGCGTGYVSAWLARRGARAVGIDNSPAQLASARQFQDAHGLPFPLIHGDAEHLPFADASFDHAISEYGAAIWCDPRVWIPEAARVLRPGGRLSTCGHVLLMLAMDEAEHVPAHRSSSGLLRDAPPGVGHGRGGVPRPHGEMIAILGSMRVQGLALRGSALPKARGPPTTSSRSTGRASGRARRCGSRAALTAAGSRQRAASQLRT
ncbi:MAG: class I SAM-dependent methyltransferase [Acidobacteriota bacterium]